MADINALAKALRSGAAAEQQMTALQPQLQNAQQLAATPMSFTPTRQGYVSPLEPILNALRAQRGTTTLERLSQQHGELGQQVSDAATQEKVYTLNQAAAKAQRERENREEDVAWREGATERALEQARRQRELEGADLATGYKTYVHKDDPTNTIHVARTKAGNLVDSERNPVASLRDYEEAPTRTETSQVSLSTHDRKKANESYQSVKQIDRIVGLAKKVKPADMERLRSAKQRFKDLLISDFAPTKLSGWLQENFGDTSPEVRNLLRNIAELSATERHKLFGAAVTGNEERDAKAWQAYVSGRSVDDLMQGIATAFEKHAAALEGYDDLGGGGYYASKLGNIKNIRVGDSAVPEYWMQNRASETNQQTPSAPVEELPVPAGVKASDWNDLREDEKRAWLDRIGKV